MMMMQLSAETTQVRGTTYRGEGRIRLGEVCSVPQQLFHHRIVPAHHCSHKTGQPTLISKCERVFRAMKYDIGRLEGRHLVHSIHRHPSSQQDSHCGDLTFTTQDMQ
jgi:hypothetical protein